MDSRFLILLKTGWCIHIKIIWPCKTTTGTQMDWCSRNPQTIQSKLYSIQMTSCQYIQLPQLHRINYHKNLLLMKSFDYFVFRHHVKFIRGLKVFKYMIHTHIHNTYMHTCIHMCTHTWIHACIHTYIHNTHIHAYMDNT